MNEVRSYGDLAATIEGLPVHGTTIIVGIDGYAGSGKSTFARLLARRVANAAIVQVDDFASWEDPLGWWPRMLEQVLKPLSAGKPGYYQRYDWDMKRLAEWHTVGARVVIVEGVSSTRHEFRDYLQYRIWVDCPQDVRLRRGLDRDGEAALPLWEKWGMAEEAYVKEQRPRESAHLVVDGNPTLPHSRDEQFVAVCSPE